MMPRNLLLLAMLPASLAACQQAGGENGQGAANAASTAGSASASGGEQGAMASQTIMQFASGMGDLSSFAKAVEAAGLSKTLTGAGPYTVFAPTNSAFQKLPGGGEAMMGPEAKGQLTSLLTYHVVPGVVTGQDISAAIDRAGGKMQMATMGGGTLTATQDKGVVTITDGKGGAARVARADMIQSNGVVHMIDGVLMPQ